MTIVAPVTGNVWPPARRTPAFACDAAAFLGVALGYRPGCEMHLLLRRTTAHVG
ncbi:hypothetical protein ACFP51_10940 [Streptomyces pratens]|uniref:Uncharacterized protein n=1 Tax=Streptomyces pratens TaxID=887456 RepID=A0ABW1M5W4_9ACTN